MDDEARRDKKYTTVSTITCLLQVLKNNKLANKHFIVKAVVYFVSLRSSPSIGEYVFLVLFHF